MKKNYLGAQIATARLKELRKQDKIRQKDDLKARHITVERM